MLRCARLQDNQRRLNKTGLQIGFDKWLKKMEELFYSHSMHFDKVRERVSGCRRLQAVHQW